MNQDETVVDPAVELAVKLGQARDCLERAHDVLESNRLPHTMLPYFRRQAEAATKLLTDIARVLVILDRRRR